MGDDLSIDDMFSDLGGLPTPYDNMTPEQRLYHEYTGEGKYQKIYNCRYWLNHELSVYNTLLDKNLLTTKMHKNQRVAVSWTELGKALLEHYFLMVAFVRFDKSAATPYRPQVDMNKFLDLILEHDEIKRTIRQYGA